MTFSFLPSSHSLSAFSAPLRLCGSLRFRFYAVVSVGIAIPKRAARPDRSCQIGSGIGMPSRSRATRERISGSPGTSTSSLPGAGGVALTAASVSPVSRRYSLLSPNAAGSMTITKTPASAPRCMPVSGCAEGTGITGRSSPTIASPAIRAEAIERPYPLCPATSPPTGRSAPPL